jgi:hypothetical protein
LRIPTPPHPERSVSETTKVKTVQMFLIATNLQQLHLLGK